MKTTNPALHDRRRKQILDAASECFVRHGFHQTTMDQICAEAGLSPGAIYRYFRSKHTIVTSIAAAYRADSIHTLKRLAGAPNFTQGFVGLVNELVRASTNKREMRLMLEIMAEASRHAEIAKILARHEATITKLLAQIIQRAADRGDVDHRIEPDIAAELLLALIDGIMGRSMFSSKHRSRALSRGLATLVTRFLRPPR